MAETVGSLHYDFDIDDKNLNKQLDDADKKVKKFGAGLDDGLSAVGKSITSAFKVATVAVAAVTAGAIAFGVKSVKAFEEAEIAQKALEHAVVGVTHATQEQLQATSDLAEELSRKGVLDDDAIKLGLAQLSTFGLSNDAVRKLGGSLADLAVNQFGVNASGEQLADTANMIAKALNGQFGILEKSGIRFTQAQKDMIQFGTEMQKVDAINQGFAQNLKFTNDVAITTFAGGVAHLKVQFGNMQETIGGITSQALVPFLRVLSEVAEDVHFDTLTKALTNFVQSKSWTMLADKTKAGLGNVVDGINKIIDAFNAGGLRAAFSEIKTQVDNLITTIDFPKLGEKIINGIFSAFQKINFAQYVEPLTQAFTTFIASVDWGQIVLIVAQQAPKIVMGLVNGILESLVMHPLDWLQVFLLLGFAPERVLVALISTFGKIPIAGPILEWLLGAMANVARSVTAPIREWFGRMGSQTVAAIKDGAVGAGDDLLVAVKGVLSRVVSAVWGFFGPFVDAGWGLLRAFGRGISGAADEVVGVVKNVLSKVRNLLPFSDAKEGPLSDLTLSGQRFATTFAAGIAQGTAAVHDAASSMLSMPYTAFSGSVFAPNVGLPSAAGVANMTGNTSYGGDTVVNIGQVNNMQDENYVLRRLDRDTTLEGMGLTPA